MLPVLIALQAHVAPVSARSALSPGVSMKLTTNPLDYSFGLQDPQLAVPGNPSGDTPPEPFPIKAEHVRTLQEDGVVHIPGVLSPEWLQYMRDVTTWQIEHPHMWASPGVVSGLYDYIQRNVWSTNSAYSRFMYYSPLGSILAQLGETDEIRVSTDLLMVNPNKGFKWHQDNQNGPVDHYNSLRFWVTLDDTPPDHGAPVFLKGSHRNKCIGDDKVFVDITEGDLADYNEPLEFRPRAGDLIVWHSRAIHKIDGPETQVRPRAVPRPQGGPSAHPAHYAATAGLGYSVASRPWRHGHHRPGAVRRGRQSALLRPRQPPNEERRPLGRGPLPAHLPLLRCGRAGGEGARRVHADRGGARPAPSSPLGAPSRRRSAWAPDPLLWSRHRV